MTSALMGLPTIQVIPPHRMPKVLRLTQGRPGDQVLHPPTYKLITEYEDASASPTSTFSITARGYLAAHRPLYLFVMFGGARTIDVH